MNPNGSGYESAMPAMHSPEPTSSRSRRRYQLGCRTGSRWIAAR